MLEEKKDKKTNWFAFLLVAVAGLGMLAIGVPFLSNSSSSDPTVATVDGQPINQSYLNRVITDLQTQFPDTPSDTIRQQALAQIIQQTLLSQYVKDRGFRISDVTLQKKIKAQFFDDYTYQEALKQSRTTPREYQEAIRNAESAGQYLNLLTRNIATPVRDKLFMSDLLQTRDVSLVTLPLSSVLDSVVIDDAKLNAFYNENKTRYMTPEKVNIDYIMLDANTLVSPDTITPEEITAEHIRDQNNEQRSGKYIIFDENDAAQQANAALKNQTRTFDAIYTDVQNGIIKGEANTLILHKKGDGPTEELDEVLFKLKQKGDVSALFSTAEYGNMIVQLDTIEQAKAVDESTIRQRIAEQKREEKYAQITETAFDAISKGDSLASIAKNIGATVQSIAQVNKQYTQPDWLKIPAVQAQIFGAKAIETGKIAEPVQIDKSHSVFFTVTARKAPEQIDFPVALATVRADYKTAKAQELLKARADEILKSWQDTNLIPDTLIRKAHGTIKQLKKINRFTNQPDLIDSSLLIALINQKTILSTVPAENGDIIISRIDNIYSGQENTTPNPLQEVFAQKVTYDAMQAVDAGIVTWLSTRARVNIKDATLKQPPQ